MAPLAAIGMSAGFNRRRVDALFLAVIAIMLFFGRIDCYNSNRQMSRSHSHSLSHRHRDSSFRVRRALPTQAESVSDTSQVSPVGIELATLSDDDSNDNINSNVNNSELDFTPANCHKVVWTASAQASVKVKESKRTCEAYMALPASEYSVLTAEQITRLSDSQFKCVLANLNFFGNKIQPVLYVDVNAYPEEAKSEIVVVRAETTGSPVAEKLNGVFSINAKNVVRAGQDAKGRKTLSSQTSLCIETLVPKSRLPLRMIQGGGNFIIQSSLTVIVAAFVRILAADFARWSSGSDARDAVDGASLQ